MALTGTLLNGMKRGLDAYRHQQTQHFGADTLIDTNCVERHAFARCTVIDGSTAADVPAGVAILAGVAHMQFASTLSAAQQASEQRLTLAQGAPNHLSLHVGVVDDQAPVVFLQPQTPVR